MRKIVSISELRDIQMCILDEVHKFCEAENMIYSISSGTLLGAIRNKGYIPWDDDMDVEMMREDYLRLLEVFKETDDYVIQTWRNDRYYSTSFAKLRDKHTIIYDSLYKYRGCFIDLFALEFTSRSMASICSYLHKFFGGRLYDILKMAKKKDTLPMKLLFRMGTVLFLILKHSYFTSIPLFRLWGRMFPHQQLRHTYGVGWINNTRCEADLFPLKRVAFEGLMLPVPHDTDNYLRRIYGNYMSLPAEKNRPNSHAQYYINI